MSDLLISELTLFCTELPKNYIYLNRSELSNFPCILLEQQLTALYVARIVIFLTDMCSFC